MQLLKSSIYLEKYKDDIRLACEMGNQYAPDIYGRFPWDRSERLGKGTNLSKACLGEFTYAVLSNGGDITGWFVMRPTCPRSSVFPRVWLTIAAKEKIEAETQFRFDPPPVVNLN